MFVWSYKNKIHYNRHLLNDQPLLKSTLQLEMGYPIKIKSEK